MERVTEYFRSAVAAAKMPALSFKDKEFVTVTADELQRGCLDVCGNKEIKSFLGSKGLDNCVIALKTVMIEFTDATQKENDIEELTSVLFLPVTISACGQLKRKKDLLPWIPRMWLAPMEKPLFLLGTAEAQDRFLEQTADKREQIKENWQKYLQYAKDLYEYVTNCPFEALSFISNNKTLKLDEKIYVFEEEVLDTTGNILQLYNDILKNQEVVKRDCTLYKNLTALDSKPSLALHENTVDAMKGHMGQMGGEYPLSPSQRKVMNHFNKMKDGEILAVNGPPGTGKTTLLQSVVANIYVKAALAQEKNPPIIVAASTNNVAVCNIIESFGKISPVLKEKIQGNLEERWIGGVNSFAVYFPSDMKAYAQKYQCTTQSGEGFIETVEAKENREYSVKKVIEECSKLYGVRIVNVSQCIGMLSATLKKYDEDRRNILEAFSKLEKTVKEKTCSAYLEELSGNIAFYANSITQIQEQKKVIEERKKSYYKRADEWITEFQRLPWYIKVFKKMAFAKRKIARCFQNFMNDDEAFLNPDMTLEEIQTLYQKKLIEVREEIDKKETEQDELEKNLQRLLDEKKNLDYLLQEIEKNQVIHFVPALQNYRDINIDLNKINDALDIIRYIEFWLAVHYYECKWLLEENGEIDNRTYPDVLIKRYHRLAMITPCMVMTLHRLPRQFLAYKGKNEPSEYLYNYIDLLIIDEGGQTTPEIAAPSFALAKKALVVGDIYQIPPIWGVERMLDVTLAKGKKVISSYNEFELLIKNGLNCSQSSIMKVASQSCNYEEDDEKGLFLCEHRRCYDEIVQYCNELVYKNRLVPLRGLSTDKKTGKKTNLPAMGHMEITTVKSTKSGGSRKNDEEADKIVEWVARNYHTICSCYEKKDQENHPELVLGIITPFKSQALQIKRKLKEKMPEQGGNIAVGTVHTFQGSERNIIIFSSVYGSCEQCYFMKNNKNLMNVAVSRAKDSFLVFGSRGCLEESRNSVSGLLKALTNAQCPEIVGSISRKTDINLSTEKNCTDFFSSGKI